jgi:glycosyltransferase involved in cell wall biosynthesis
LRSAKHGSIEALVRFSDLEMFAMDSQSKKIWETFDQRLPSPQTFQYLNLWAREGLLCKAAPAPLKTILVTVMMTAHNAEHWIAEAIESVLTQTFKDFELLIVDNGSTDRTARIVRQYTWDQRLKFFQNKRQLGIAPSRNRILSLARGQYIAVCDADDLMRPTLLQRLTSFLESHPKVGWVYADCLYINKEGRSLGARPAVPMDGTIEYQRNVMQHAGALIRRKLMLAVGGYDTTMRSCEDYDLALKISKRAKILALPGENHYLYRRHADSISVTDPWASRETARLLRRHKASLLAQTSRLRGL